MSKDLVNIKQIIEQFYMSVDSEKYDFSCTGMVILINK